MRTRAYKRGSYLAQDDRSGMIHLACDMEREWTGNMVLKGTADKRHPQETLQVSGEHAFPPWTRPPQSTDD